MLLRDKLLRFQSDLYCVHVYQKSKNMTILLLKEKKDYELFQFKTVLKWMHHFHGICAQSKTVSYLVCEGEKKNKVLRAKSTCSGTSLAFIG